MFKSDSNRRSRRISVCLMILIVSVAPGCKKPLPPDTRPTAFFDWCAAADKFGVKSPEGVGTNNSTKNILSGEIGVVQYRGILAEPVVQGKVVIGWRNCKTDEEAGQHFHAIAKELRRVAEEKGITLEGKDDPKASEIVLKYRSGQNDGTLEGKYELGDTKDAGKDVKAWMVELKLREVIREL
jgi:hypothetical protein